MRIVSLLAGLLCSVAHAADKAAPPLAVVQGQLRQTSPLYVTAPPYSAACDGTTDDEAAFEAAAAAVSAAGGGTVVVPGGKTCRIGGDIAWQSNVDLRCEPGGTLKPTDGGSFTLGVVALFFTGNTDVHGCTFDLNGKATAAVASFAASGVRFERNVVKSGATSNGTEWNLLALNCTTTRPCEAIGNRIECASTSGANDVGLALAGSGDEAQIIRATGNSILGCDLYGINHTAGAASIEGGAITVTGTSAVGVRSTVADTTIRGVKIATSGATAKGVLATGARSSVVDNKIRMPGTSAIAIRVEGAQSAVVGNAYRLTSVTAGDDNDTAIGIYVAGDGTTVLGNTGSVSTNDAQTQLVVAAAHVTATGNYWTGGGYCTAPSQESSSHFLAGINQNFVGNRCYTARKISGVFLTGAIVANNYFAWAGSIARATVMVGDDRGPYKASVLHATFVGNRFHSQEAVPGVIFATVDQTCNAGSNEGQACTADNTTQCPGATCGDCCVARGYEDVVFTGNEFLYQVNGAGPAISLAGGVTATSGDTADIIIDGNVFDLNNNNTLLACPSSNQSKVHGIVLGENAQSAGTAKSNCTTSMVRDANEFVACVTKASLAAADDDFPIFYPPFPITVTAVGCNCQGGCSGTDATFGFEDAAGNAMTVTGGSPTCSESGADGTFAAVTAGGSINAGEAVAFDVTNTPQTGQNYVVCIQYRKS